MPRLKSRNVFPPGQFQFTQPQTGWTAMAGSHESVSIQLYRHRLGNRAICQQYKLSTDIEVIRNEVEEFNAARCISHGWLQFVQEAPTQSFRVPTMFRSLSANVVGSVKKVVAGVKAIALWLGDGLTPVPQALAESRAGVCAACDFNGDPNFIEKLSAEGAAQIKEWMAIKNDLALKTPYDAQLKTCKICSCMNGLKIWADLKHINKTVDDEVKAKLPAHCWVVVENQKQVEVTKAA